jgi:hypothetical protein
VKPIATTHPAHVDRESKKSIMRVFPFELLYFTGNSVGIYTELGLRRGSVHRDVFGVEPVVVQAARVVDDLEFREPVKADVGIRAG